MKEAKLFQGLSRLFQGRGREAALESAEAFSLLYDQAYLSVYRYLFGLHGGPAEDVEDLAAETFLRAWRARRTFNGGLTAGATGWLLRIARRLAIDAYRRGRARIPPGDALPDEVPCPGLAPEHLALAGEQRRTLWVLLQRLPIEQREMLVLRYLLDWRVNQIGEYLGIPENTVSVTIRRALERLRRDWPDGKE